MRMIPEKLLTLRVAMLVLVAAGLMATGIALKSASSDAASPPAVPAALRTDATPISRIPDHAIQLVAALSGPAATAVPPMLDSVAANAPFRGAYAPNVTLSRSVPALGSGTPSEWYLVPGDDSLCLFAQGVFMCRTLTELQSGAFYFTTYEPVGRSAIPPAGTPAEMSVVGVVPNGVTAVSARTVDGKHVRGVVSDNVFRVDGTDLSVVTLGQSGQAPIEIPLGRR